MNRMPRYMRCPDAWTKTEAPFPNMFAFESPGGLTVITTRPARYAEDGRRWLHVSCSRPDQIPSYGDLYKAKRLFIGANKKALQVFAPASEHVNLHPNTLHLWHCVDGPVTPDFSAGTGII